MRLKTRRKKRQTNIIKKAKKGSMKCSKNIKFNYSNEYESILLCVKESFFYVGKNTKSIVIWKRKNNYVERKFIFNNNGDITRSPKENIMIEYKKNKEVEQK